jgi:hypothetical protein
LVVWNWFGDLLRQQIAGSNPAALTRFSLLSGQFQILLASEQFFCKTILDDVAGAAI